MALLGTEDDRHYIGTAAVVVNKLNRDLFWRAVELADPDKKKPDANITWMKPGLVGRVKFLAGSTGLDMPL